MINREEEHQNVNCPLCGKELDIDSIREHRDGKKRIYWECKDCNASVMARGKKSE